MKVERTGGRKGREIELGRGLRKGNGGDTGRDDEHEGIKVTKLFIQKHHVFRLVHSSLYR